MTHLSRRSLAVAVGASLLAHGLLAAVTLLAPGGGEVRGQVPFSTVVVDRGCTLTVEFAAPAHGGPPLPVAPEKPPGDFEAKLVAADPPPVESAVYQAPVVDIPPASDPAGAGGNGGAAAGSGGARLFQVTAPCQSVVYVLDCSLTMGLYGAFDAARREVLASVRALPPSTKFQVVLYTRTARPLPSGRADGYLTPDADTLGRVAAALEGTTPGGATGHANALDTALRLRPEVIFFVTDADELRSQDVAKLVKRARGGTVIHAVELSAVPAAGGDTPLRQLARQTRGVYRNVIPRD